MIRKKLDEAEDWRLSLRLATNMRALNKILTLIQIMILDYKELTLHIPLTQLFVKNICCLHCMKLDTHTHTYNVYTLSLTHNLNN